MNLEETAARISITWTEVSHEQDTSSFFRPREGRHPKAPPFEKTPVSDLCDELGIGPSQFYRWQKEFFENGHAAFENNCKSKAVGDAKQRRIEHLEAKLQRKNEVLSELIEEHIQLKKELGEP